LDIAENSGVDLNTVQTESVILDVRLHEPQLCSATKNPVTFEAQISEKDQNGKQLEISNIQNLQSN
jgi:uncharacterized protein YchJ